MAKKPAPDQDDATDPMTDDVVKTDESDGVEDAEIVDENDDLIEDEPQDTQPEDDVVALSEPEEETSDTPPEPDEPEPQQPSPAVESAPARSSSFIPLVLGGLAAGFIGYGASYLQQPQDDTDVAAELSAQAQTIDSLQSQLNALPAAPELGGIEGQLSDLNATLEETRSTFDARLSDFDDRLAAVERQPSADGTLQDTALAAYERELDELRAQFASQEDELREMMDATAAQLETTRQEAAEIQQNAVQAARDATARAAVAKIASALESGAPFGAALTELTDTTEEPAPPALEAVADGAPTLASLQASFPSAAREALAVARSEGASGEDSGGLSSFLRSQFDVRSVAPREGGSADAVLSRAEAALREGRLNDTLAEIAALPEVARGALTDWTAQAEARAAALDATLTLSSQFADN